MKLAPSILACDFARLGEEISAAEAGGADWIHVDVMDGHFVPNISIGPGVTAAARSVTDLPLDVHLMIEDPDRYLEDFVKAGAAVVTVHQEACTHLHRTLAHIRSLGVQAGVALNPATPVGVVEDVLDLVDVLVIMSVNPGFGGQSFLAGSVDRVRRARRMLSDAGSSAEVEVDGGVDATNAGALTEAGASVLVAGSSVFRHPEGAAAALGALRAAVSS